MPRVGWGIFDYFTRKVYEVHEEACKDGGYVKYVPWADVKVEEAEGKTHIVWKEQQAWMVHGGGIDYRYEQTTFKLNTSTWDWEEEKKQGERAPHKPWLKLTEDDDVDKLASLESEIKRLTEELKQKDETIKDNEAQIATSGKSVEALQKELELAKAKADEGNTSEKNPLEEQYAELRTLHAELEQSKSTQADVEKQLAEAREAEKKALADIEELKKKAVVKSQANEALELEKELDKVRKELASSKDTHTMTHNLFMNYLRQIKTMFVKDGKINEGLRIDYKVIMSILIIVYHLRQMLQDPSFIKVTGEQRELYESAPDIIYKGLVAAVTARAGKAKSITPPAPGATVTKRNGEKVPEVNYVLELVNGLEKPNSVYTIISRVMSITNFVGYTVGSLDGTTSKDSPEHKFREFLLAI